MFANVPRAGDRNPVLRLRQGYGACTLLQAGVLSLSVDSFMLLILNLLKMFLKSSCIKVLSIIKKFNKLFCSRNFIDRKSKFHIIFSLFIPKKDGKNNKSY